MDYATIAALIALAAYMATLALIFGKQ